MRERGGKEDSWDLASAGRLAFPPTGEGDGQEQTGRKMRVAFAPNKFKMLRNVQGTTGLLGQSCEVQKRDLGWRCQQVQQPISDTGCVAQE